MKIVIELNDAGQLLVNGDCLQHKVLAIGMLEMAKNLIAAPQAVIRPPIEVANPEATKAILGNNGVAKRG